jgi:predicted ABC-type transport system involved in lysophospholipase L1 biosynthesis ATPase subunit
MAARIWSVLVGCGPLTWVSCTASIRTGASVPSIAALRSAIFSQRWPAARSPLSASRRKPACIAASRSSSRAVAIVGASGSGKSSLVNLLCGIDYPTTGTVSWEGRPLRSRRSWARLRRDGIGIVFQEFNLIPTLTALENVELALFGRGLSAAHRNARAAVVLDRVGLDGRMHHLVTKLSGGERQRVAIAIVMEPKLLLADEPTGNLDSINEASVADLLAGEAARHRRADERAGDAVFHLPTVLRKAPWFFVRRNPYWFKDLAGTAGVTSMGMFASGAAVGVPITPMTLTLTIGAIEKKLVLEGGQAVERDVVHLNVSADHDIIDGAPLMRSAERFKQMLADGTALKAQAPQESDRAR